MGEIRPKSDLFVQSEIAMSKMHLLLALQSGQVGPLPTKKPKGKPPGSRKFLFAHRQVQIGTDDPSTKCTRHQPKSLGA